MKKFIKDYIFLLSDMATAEADQVEFALDTFEVLTSGDNDQILKYVIKPLLTEYRETENKTDMEEIELLFKQLLNIVKGA